MWLRNGILSNKQFMKHLGRDIFIYPFKENNLKGSSYNLTASRVAYYKDKDGNLVSALVNKDKIIIPKQKLIHIQTEESIYITRRICGTYHTKVKWANEGLSSVSTTLDPCYFGTSLITLYNFSNKDIELDVGETFCTLILHKMSSGDKDSHDNVPFRKDISSGKIYNFDNVYDIIMLKKEHKLEEEQEIRNKIPQIEKILKKELREQGLKLKNLEYKNYLEEWYEEDFRRNKEVLIKKVKEEVKKANNEKLENRISFILVCIYIICIGISTYFLIKDIKEDLITIAFFPAITAVFSFLHSRLIKFFKEIWYLIEIIKYKIIDL